MTAGLGTVINVAAIAGGTALGLLVGKRLPERLRVTILQGVGLLVVAIGLGSVLESHNVVFPLIAVVAGTVVGELLRIEDRLEGIGRRLRDRFERERADGEEPSTFVEAFVAASLLFCVGPLAILGSIEDGLSGEIGLLSVKSALDGLVSLIFAATLGWGVVFSTVPVAIYQGVLTLAATGAESVLTERMITELSATGGVMIMAIGVRLLDLKLVRVGSMLPGLVLAPVLVSLFAR